jgi:hypothetical protein
MEPIKELLLAASLGNTKKVGELAKSQKAWLDEALIHGCFGGHKRIVEILLKEGARADYQNGICMVFAAQNGHTKIVETLLKQGSKPHGHTAIREAHSAGYDQTVKVLLKACEQKALEELTQDPILGKEAKRELGARLSLKAQKVRDQEPEITP